MKTSSAKNLIKKNSWVGNIIRCIPKTKETNDGTLPSLSRQTLRLHGEHSNYNILY